MGPGRRGGRTAAGQETGSLERDWFVNVALDDICKDTHTVEIELIVDLPLKQNVKAEVHTLGFEAFFALCRIITVDSAFERMFCSSLFY